MAEGFAAGFLSTLTGLGTLDVLGAGGSTVEGAVANGAVAGDGFEGCIV